MKLKEFKEASGLSFQDLGDMLGWSKAKAYQYCCDCPPCMKLVDAHTVVRITKGKVTLEDLMPEDC